MVLDVIGGLSSVTGNQLAGGLQEVTSVSLVSTTGVELEALTPVKLSDQKEYEADIRLPSEGKFHTATVRQDNLFNTYTVDWIKCTCIRLYLAASFLGFHVALYGIDTEGNLIQRYDTAVVTTALNMLRLELESEGSPTAPPGELVNITIRMTNIGESKIFEVDVSDSEGYLQSVHPNRYGNSLT